MGCFNPDKSDIDLIIVTEEAPTEEQKLQLMEQTVGLNELAPEKGIEMSVVKRSCCETVSYTHLDVYKRQGLPIRRCAG